MVGIVTRFRTTSKQRDIVRRLYVAAVEQARDPHFYRDHGVPDTLDGRFDMIALHVFLILHRLRQDGRPRKAMSQALFDMMFADMDESLRELGVGDLAVGGRVKAMAKALYGRIAAYQSALDSDNPGDLMEAFRRNVFRGAEAASADAEALANYARAQATHLGAIDPIDETGRSATFLGINAAIAGYEMG